MNKILNKIKNIAMWIWQAPQNIAGVITYHCYKGYEICTDDTCGVGIKCKLSTKISGGIALGSYIVLNNVSHLEHELGHTKQSRMLGPLYLLVIGLPSGIHRLLHDKVCKNKSYYHFYTEKWADKLAGVER